MQTAGRLIGVIVKLAACVQDSQHDFHGGFVWIVFVLADGDAAPFVGYGYRIVIMDRDIDVGAVACAGFVDGVVYDFVDEVMKAVGAGAADVHCGPFADSFKPLKNDNIAFIIIGWLF